MSDELIFDGVTVAFAGVTALAELSLTARCDEVLGVIGPNGAGKTTLLNAATGLVPVRAGAIRFAGRDLRRASTTARARLGLGRTFQTPRLFSSLTVLQNVQVAARQGDRRHRGTDACLELLELTGLRDRAGEPADALTAGEQRFCEIARALALRPRLLLLDEPATGLRDDEVVRLAQLLAELAARGLGTMIVDHDMRLIMRACARLAVVEFGRLIAHGATADVRRDPAVVRAYLGEEQLA